MKIKVGVSNRHVHLNKDTYEYLFGGKEIKKRNDLHQVGEFASTDTVDLKFGEKTISGVRVVGPLRSQNQIELLGTDFELLGIEQVVRRSGQLENTPKISIKVGSLEVESTGVIRAERHVHVPTSDENTLGLHERDTVKIVAPKGEFYANVKVSDNGYFEVHIDKDEAEEYGLVSGDEVELLPCGK